MFGFLIGAEVNDDAVALKLLTDTVLNRYGELNRDQLVAAIEQDFADKARKISADHVTFIFPEQTLFQFNLFHNVHDVLHRVNVMGLGKYTGFAMQVMDGNSWHCFTMDDPFSRATGGAKQLVKVLSRKFSIDDTTNIFERVKRRRW